MFVREGLSWTRLLQACMVHLSSIFRLRYEPLFGQHPQLVLSNLYRDTYSHSAIRPYEEQVM